MLLPVLITITIIVVAVVLYFFVIAPRLNPINKAESFVEQNMVGEAIIEYKKILENSPNDFSIHYKLSNLYFKQKKTDQAVLHLEEIVRINKYNYEVDKIDVWRKLAKAYQSRDDMQRTFQTYMDILTVYPTDEEALYQVGFIALGQELFELAEKQFNRLVAKSPKNFEVFFGAGIAYYQDMNTGEAIQYFKEALVIDPHSDIANIAMAFAQQRKRNFKTGVNYAKMVVDNSPDSTAIFIAKRLLGILYIQAKKASEGMKIFEELLAFTKENDMIDEQVMILYDLGFASIKAEQTSNAYEYWNQLYQLDRGYKDVQKLITILRKEMDADTRQKTEALEESVIDYIDEWLKDVFPKDFLWNICGLKSNRPIDLGSIATTTRVSASKTGPGESKGFVSADPSELVLRFCSLDVENFRIIANRLVTKLGYSVEDILETYRESDGVDFMARARSDNHKTLVWVRRWKGAKVGEIPLRNFAQAVNDAKAREGLFVTTSDMTSSAESALARLSKVTIVLPEQTGEMLADLL
ncbi:MAG: tetratricopeptide repeat protein [bacterium]|nr:tetratricopeptide repeat protein [bacterium]